MMPGSRPRVVILEAETGEWLQGSQAILLGEAFVLAASLLPGTTPRDIELAYQLIMREKGMPAVVFPTTVQPYEKENDNGSTT